MDTTELVTELEKDTFNQLAECLNQIEDFGLIAVLLLSEDGVHWEFVVSSTAHRNYGPIQTYEDIQSCMNESFQDVSFSLSDIKSVSDKDDFVSGFRDQNRIGVPITQHRVVKHIAVDEKRYEKAYVFYLRPKRNTATND